MHIPVAKAGITNSQNIWTEINGRLVPPKENRGWKWVLATKTVTSAIVGWYQEYLGRVAFLEMNIRYMVCHPEWHID